MLARNVLLTREWPYSLDAATLYCIPAAGRRTLRMCPISGEEETRWSPGIAAGQQRVWCSALVLTDELVDRHVDALRGGARVLELGCGLGLPGMACAALGARTLLTDMPQAMPRVEESIRDNYERGWKGAGSVRAVSLEWDAIAAEILVLQEGRFDFILCSDCVYESCYGESWRELAEAIDKLSDERTTVLVSMQRRDDPALDAFVARLEEDFQVELLCSRKALSGMVEVYSARRRVEAPAALENAEAAPALAEAAPVLADAPAEVLEPAVREAAAEAPDEPEIMPAPPGAPEAPAVGKRPARRGGFSSLVTRGSGGGGSS